MPSDNIKTDLSYKKFSKKEYTSIDKKWHEEFPGKAINIKSKDIWVDEVPLTPPLTTTTIVEVFDDLTLTEDVTVNDSLSWLACSTPGDLGTRIGDFIQPDKDLSQQYYVSIFDDNGTQIFVGDQVAWEFDYANGILSFEYPPSAFTSPFHIKAYRYIGDSGLNDYVPQPTPTLDQVYDGPTGDGSGKIINIDRGPVEFNASNGSAALKISPIVYTPNTDLEEGQLINRGGILYIYDETRSKWVSSQKNNIIFGAKRADGVFLSINDFSSNLSGWPAMRDGVITGISAQASGGYSAKQFSILKNNSPTPLFNFNLTGHYYTNGNVNIDFDMNDLVKILTSSEYATTFNVIINVEVAWRLDP